MLSERQLEALLMVFQNRMQEVTNDYLRMMGAHLRDIGELTPSDIHRLKEMKRVGANVKKIKQKIAKAANISMEDLERVLLAAAESNMQFAEQWFATGYTAKVKGRAKMSTHLERILKAQMRTTAQTMQNISKSTVLSSTYQGAVDAAVQAVQSGIADYNSAIRNALKRAAGDGLRVQYESGHTRRLDSAMRQNVLDGVRELNRDMLEQLGKEYGADGVELSAHYLCAEDHLPYQGRQFSMKEFERIQNSLDRPFGMWNCKHTIFPIIMGVSVSANGEEELAEYRRNSAEQITIDGVTKSRYEWTQEQRRIETAVRQQKDIGVAAQASGDMALRREAQANINKLMNHYDRISEQAGLHTQYDRTRFVGFRSTKTMNELQKNVAVASPRFLQKNDILYKNAAHIKPIRGYEDVVVHADRYGFVFKDANGNESNVSVAEFAEIIRQTDTYHGGNIRLIACDAAADGAITAQALSDILGVEILAPNDVVYVDPKGNLTIGNPLTNVGKWVRIKPRR